MPGFRQTVSAVMATSMLLLPPQAAVADGGFVNFKQDADRISGALDCPHPKITPAQAGLGALYGCITGAAETAKLWINERADQPGMVSNVKVMWNDWTRDVGYGIHADKNEATMMVRVIADLYAPELKEDLLKIFFDDLNGELENSRFQFTYTLSSGPGIDEHLLIITEK